MLKVKKKPDNLRRIITSTPCQYRLTEDAESVRKQLAGSYEPAWAQVVLSNTNSTLVAVHTDRDSSDIEELASSFMVLQNSIPLQGKSYGDATPPAVRRVFARTLSRVAHSTLEMQREAVVNLMSSLTYEVVGNGGRTACPFCAHRKSERTYARARRQLEDQLRKHIRERHGGTTARIDPRLHLVGSIALSPLSLQERDPMCSAYNSHSLRPYELMESCADSRNQTTAFFRRSIEIAVTIYRCHRYVTRIPVVISRCDI